MQLCGPDDYWAKDRRRTATAVRPCSRRTAPQRMASSLGTSDTRSAARLALVIGPPVMLRRRQGSA